MSKLEQLKLAIAARNASLNGKEWDGCDRKVKELLYELTPFLIDAVSALESCHARLEILVDSGNGKMLDATAKQRAAAALGNLK